jgi:hypothetical protein
MNKLLVTVLFGCLALGLPAYAFDLPTVKLDLPRPLPIPGDVPQGTAPVLNFSTCIVRDGRTVCYRGDAPAAAAPVVDLGAPKEEWPPPDGARRPMELVPDHGDAPNGTAGVHDFGTLDEAVVASSVTMGASVEPCKPRPPVLGGIDGDSPGGACVVYPIHNCQVYPSDPACPKNFVAGSWIVKGD